MLNKYMTAFVIIATTLTWSSASQAVKVCGCFYEPNKIHCSRNPNYKDDATCGFWCRSKYMKVVAGRMVEESKCTSFQ